MNMDATRISIKEEHEIIAETQFSYDYSKICNTDDEKLKRRIRKRIERQLMSDYYRKKTNERERIRKQEARKNLEYRMRENERERERKREMRKNVEFRARERERERIRKRQKRNAAKCTTGSGQVQELVVHCPVDMILKDGPRHLQEQWRSYREEYMNEYRNVFMNAYPNQYLNQYGGHSGFTFQGHQSSEGLCYSPEVEEDTMLRCPAQIILKQEPGEDEEQWSEPADEYDQDTHSSQVPSSVETHNRVNEIIVKEESLDVEETCIVKEEPLEIEDTWSKPTNQCTDTESNQNNYSFQMLLSRGSYNQRYANNIKKEHVEECKVGQVVTLPSERRDNLGASCLLETGVGVAVEPLTGK